MQVVEESGGFRFALDVPSLCVCVREGAFTIYTLFFVTVSVAVLHVLSAALCWLYAFQGASSRPAAPYRRWRKKANGYCEMCNVRYQDLDEVRPPTSPSYTANTGGWLNEHGTSLAAVHLDLPCCPQHVTTPKHMSFESDADNWLALDNFIADFNVELLAEAKAAEAKGTHILLADVLLVPMMS